MTSESWNLSTLPVTRRPPVFPQLFMSTKEFSGRPIHDAASNLPREAAPRIQCGDKISPKEIGKMNRTADEARTELDLGAGTSKTPALASHQERRITENGDQKTAVVSKKTQSSTDTTKRLQVRDQAKSCHRNLQRSENEQQKEVAARNRVMDILHKFREYCDKLSDMKRTNNQKQKNCKRVDLLAAQMVKGEFGYSSEKQYLGPVPGVRIGDKFFYRMELHVLGLHRPPQSGIDTMYYGGEKIATSVVASGGYNNDMRDPNTLIYCGHGGNASGNQEHVEDQKLEGGNRALLNSKRAKNPVRVIRGRKELKYATVYVYDGLYTVEGMWEVEGRAHHKIFKFKLVKIPEQSCS